MSINKICLRSDFRLFLRGGKNIWGRTYLDGLHPKWEHGSMWNLVVMMMMRRRRRRMRMRMMMRMMIGYTLGTRMGHLYIALQCLGRTPGMFFGVEEGSHFPKMLCFHQEGGGRESPMFHDFGMCLHIFDWGCDRGMFFTVGRSRILSKFQPHTRAVQVATVIAHLRSQFERYS